MNAKNFFFTQMFYVKAVHDMIRPAKQEKTNLDPLVEPYIKCKVNDYPNHIKCTGALRSPGQTARDGWVYILLENYPNITTIDDACFQDNSNLTEIVFPDTITKLGDNSFQGCTELKVINLEHIQNIGKHGIEYCHGLTSIELPEVNTLGTNAIRNCKALTNVHLGSHVTDILSGNFTACPYLKSLTIDAITPPTLEGTVFAEVANDFKIIVPTGAVDDYKAAPTWKDFSAKIVGNASTQSVKKSNNK